MKYRVSFLASCVLFFVGILCGVLCCLRVIADGNHSPEASREELLIKNVYLKLSLYNAATNKDDAEGKLSKYEAQNDISFEIRNVKTGPISEILDKNLYDLTTYPSGDLIQLTRATTTFNGGREEFIGYSAQWQVGQYTSVVVPQKISLQEVFRLSGSQYFDIGKYSSYEVKVQLGRKSRIYNAIVLYHVPNQSTPDLKPEFWDPICGSGGALNDVWSERKPLIGSQRIGNLNIEPEGENQQGIKNPSSRRGFNEISKTKTVFECSADQPICCPQTASSISQCCWNSDYSFSNPGVIPDCKKSGIRSNSRQTSVIQPTNKANTDQASAACMQDIRIGSPEIFFDSNTADHVTGYHSYRVNMQGQCKQEANCYRSCRISTDSRDYYETPVFISHFYLFHNGKQTDNEERGGGFGDSVTCKKSHGVGTMGCFIPYCGGSVSVTLPTGVSGRDLAVTVSGGDLWNRGFGLAMECRFNGGGGSGGGGQTSQCGIGTGLYCYQGNSFCLPYTFPSGNCCCSMSPIVIDISRYWDWMPNSGNGYHFTDVNGGVRFDLNGDGIKEQVAWPTATSENAWLALDRNGNGLIDSGKELFGNFTDQVGLAGEPIQTGQGNGWLALAELDRGRSGGNENGMVDSGDAGFENLRLWVDRNHNGISEPNELLPLASIGLTGIELTYDSASGWTDQYGNSFKLRSRFRWGDRDDPESFYTEWFKDAWDVFPLWTP